MRELPEYVEGLPNICGQERDIERAIDSSRGRPVFLPESRIAFGSIKSAFANALHMHQPLIPAGGGDLATAEVISNLQYMMEHPDVGDNHNAPVFRWCYKRMGEFIPQLVGEGKEPRIMLEYSGTLLHGLAQDGRQRRLRQPRDDHLQPGVPPLRRVAGRALGTRRGALHAGAGLSPAREGLAAPFRGHLRPGGALPRARLLAVGDGAAEPSGRRLRVREDLAGLRLPVGPGAGAHRRAAGGGLQSPSGRTCRTASSARNSAGETASIVAFVKTQGSDTKLVAQMQPAYEARSLGRMELAGRQVPPLVTQIADGENGGVMMNEFPPKYIEVMREASGSETPAMNCTEYLEHLFAAGIGETDLPALQPLYQKQIWERMKPGDGPDRLGQVIETLRKEDHRFHMEGGSWTSNLSWVRGYESVLEADGGAQLPLLRDGHPARSFDLRGPLPQRAVPPALRPRPAATAIGAKASGPSTAGSCAAARTRS